MEENQSTFIQSELEEDLSLIEFQNDLKKLKIMIRRAKSKLLIYERRLKNYRDIKQIEKMDLNRRLDHHNLLNHSGGDA